MELKYPKAEYDREFEELKKRIRDYQETEDLHPQTQTQMFKQATATFKQAAENGEAPANARMLALLKVGLW